MLISYDDLDGPATVKLIPEQLVTYKVFGEPGGPHYAHYDLVGGRLVRIFFFFFLGGGGGGVGQG